MYVCMGVQYENDRKSVFKIYKWNLLIFYNKLTLLFKYNFNITTNLHSHFRSNHVNDALYLSIVKLVIRIFSAMQISYRYQYFTAMWLLFLMYLHDPIYFLMKALIIMQWIMHLFHVLSSLPISATFLNYLVYLLLISSSKKYFC